MSLIANDKWNQIQHKQFHPYAKCMVYVTTMQLTCDKIGLTLYCAMCTINNKCQYDMWHVY